MCKVKVFITEVDCKYIIGDSDQFKDGTVSIMGRIRSKERRTKAAKLKMATYLGINPADFVGYKESAFRIKECDYHVSWNDIKKYGKEIDSTVIFEG